MKIHTVKSDFPELFGKRKIFTKTKDKYSLSCPLWLVYRDQQINHQINERSWDRRTTILYCRCPDRQCAAHLNINRLWLKPGLTLSKTLYWYITGCGNYELLQRYYQTTTMQKMQYWNVVAMLMQCCFNVKSTKFYYRSSATQIQFNWVWHSCLTMRCYYNDSMTLQNNDEPSCPRIAKFLTKLMHHWAKLYWEYY